MFYACFTVVLLYFLSRGHKGKVIALLIVTDPIRSYQHIVLMQILDYYIVRTRVHIFRR